MSIKWKKLGWVYAAHGEQPWAQTHAFLPTPLLRQDGRIRVYVAFLDEEKMGRVGYVDVAEDDPRRVLEVSRRPLLDVGRPGCFDEHGVNPLCLVRGEDALYLYYVGWQRSPTVRYFLFTGLAVSRDGGESFERYSPVPILDRSRHELFVRTGCHVLREGNCWKMWYLGGDCWVESRGKLTPSYSLRNLESADGIHWGAEGAVCLEPRAPEEIGFGRPFLRRTAKGYQMWYSIRTLSAGYRPGYAESPDGRHWQRKDGEAGLQLGQGGWDSEMICFGALLECRGNTYLFYNGNNYGETGFGVAVREDE
jgi:hypothetical protein